MEAKKPLYFEAGAEEVWLCAADGTLQIINRTDPGQTYSAARNFHAALEKD